MFAEITLAPVILPPEPAPNITFALVTFTIFATPPTPNTILPSAVAIETLLVPLAILELVSP